MLPAPSQGHPRARVESLERRTLLSVVISEILAQNTAVNADENGTFSDWIEFHNPDAVPYNLSGHFLTDDPDEPTQWQFPSGVTIAPGGHLLVWASGKDRRNPAGPLHTNFAMSAGGEYLALIGPNGTQVLTAFAPAFPAQSANVSYGLAPDGSGSLTFFNQPTPGAPNAGVDVGAVAAPVVNVERGFYDAPFDLVIQTPTAGATIRYTTDGSAPSPNSGNVYTGPIRIDKTRSIRAIAYKAGGSASAVITQTYLFLDSVLQQPSSIAGYPNTSEDVNGGSVVADTAMDPAVVNNPAYSTAIRTGLKSIPTIAITTKLTDIFGAGGFYDSDVEKGVSVELIDPTHPGNTGQVNAGAEAHSHDRLKRSLRISFKAQYGPTKWKTDLLNDAPVNGDSAEGELDDLVLRAGNNRAWTRLSSPDATTFTEDQWYRDTQIAMSGYGSHGTYVHLYLNGAYWGLYNVAERPDVAWQSRYFGGDAEDYFGTNHDDEREGDDSRWDTLLNTVIKKDMSVRSNYDQLRDYLDVNGFADYLILNWFQATTDWPSNNFYVGSQNEPETTGAKFFAWDGEWGWDQGLRTEVDGAWVHPAFKAGSTDATVLAQIWRSAIKSSDFKMLFADRVYKHLANGGALTAAAITERFDTLNAYVRDAVIAESARWGDALKSLGQPTRTRDVDWQREVDVIRGMMQDNGTRFVDALRDENYYPDLDPATFGQRGGPVVPGFELVLNNPNDSGTIYYTTDGTDPRAKGGGLSSSAIAYAGPITLDASVTIRSRVRAGSAWSASDAADFSVSAFSALRVVELMYNPAPSNDGTDGDEFEFIRLRNTGAAALRLAGVELSGGIEFTFGDVEVPAGGVITLVENPVAFAARYDAAVTIDGKYTEKLDDGGERLQLLDDDGNAILDFEYDDAWYPQTDGDGYSLVIIDPAAAPVTWDNAASWRPSAAVGGSPATNGQPQPTNQPPTVDAAGPASVVLPNASTVTATVVDDGLPAGGATSIAWSLVSGPGSVAFSDPAAASTNVAFSVAGNYVLRATASDGVLTASADVSVQAVSSATEPPPPTQPANAVTRFMLVDPWTGQDVRVLSNGDTINLSEFTRGKVNIRADVAGDIVASVRFGFDKKPGRFKPVLRTDSDRPFSLLGDKRGIYKKGALTVGTHRLVATPFDAAKGRGTAGTAIEITFNVVKQPLQLGPSGAFALETSRDSTHSTTPTVASLVLEPQV